MPMMLLHALAGGCSAHCGRIAHGSPMAQSRRVPLKGWCGALPRRDSPPGGHSSGLPVVVRSDGVICSDGTVQKGGRGRIFALVADAMGRGRRCCCRRGIGSHDRPRSSEGGLGRYMRSRVLHSCKSWSNNIRLLHRAVKKTGVILGYSLHSAERECEYHLVRTFLPSSLLWPPPLHTVSIHIPSSFYHVEQRL